MATKLVIYDGECSYCRGFARMVRALDVRKRFALLPFESEDAQRLLRAQFGENFGFAMFLFEEESVSWGREAAQRIVHKLGIPGARLMFWVYPSLVSLISKLTHRQRRVCGPECAGENPKSQGLPLSPQIKQHMHELLERLTL